MPARIAPTGTPAPNATPVPTITPAPTMTPAPTATPAPGTTPVPTGTPEANGTPSPTIIQGEDNDEDLPVVGVPETGGSAPLGPITPLVAGGSLAGLGVLALGFRKMFTHPEELE